MAKHSSSKKLQKKRNFSNFADPKKNIAIHKHCLLNSTSVELEGHD